MSDGAEHLLEVAAGEYIFREGDLGTEMYVIRRGRVEILKQVEGAEDDHTQLAVFEQGDFFGELSLLDDEPRSASVRALEDSVLIRINGSTFIQMLSETPEIAVRMMRKLSRRLRHTDRLLQDALERGIRDTPRVAAEVEVAVETPPSEEPVDRVVEAPPEPTPEAADAPRYSLYEPNSGATFPLGPGRETLIGRADAVTGIDPTVDLTPVDHQRSSSRRHARILRRDDKLFLAEEVGSMNGTFVNGRRLETADPVEVQPGDRLRFGVLELELRVD